MSVLSLSYKESDVRLRNTSQSLTYNMAENSWHRYDMKKLRHCHPMYRALLHPLNLRIQRICEIYLPKAVAPCSNKIILKNCRPETPPSVARPIFYLRRGSTIKLKIKSSKVTRNLLPIQLSRSPARTRPHNYLLHFA